MKNGVGAIHVVYLIVLGALPWMYGTVEKWSVNGSVTALFLLFVWAVLRNSPKFLKSLRTPAVIVMFILAALVAIYCLHKGYLSPFGSIPKLQSDPSWLPASVQPSMSIQKSVLWFGWIVAIWGIFLAFTERSQRTFLIWGLMINCLLLVGIAFLQRYTGTQKILWIRPLTFVWDWKTIGHAPFVGPFVNRGHFAMYLLLYAPFAFYLWHRASRSNHKHLGYFTDGHVFVMLAIAWMGVGVLFAGSRGAILVMAVLVAVSPFLFYRIIFQGGRTPFLIGTLAVLIAIFSFVKPQMFDRLTASFMKGSGAVSSDQRWLIWKDVGQLISQSPWWGWGPGSFRDVFVFVQSPKLLYRVEFAHNDYLEFLFEVGWVGSFLFWGLVIFLLCAAIWKLFRLESRTDTVFIQCGLLSLFGCLIYACIDFPLQMGGLSLTACAVFGLVLAVEEDRQRRQDRAA